MCGDEPLPHLYSLCLKQDLLHLCIETCSTIFIGICIIICITFCIGIYIVNYVSVAVGASCLEVGAYIAWEGATQGRQEAEGETEGLRVTFQIQRARAAQGTQQGLCAHQGDPFLPLILLVIG